MKANPVLLVHGGAGSKPPRKASLDVLAESLAKGYTILLNGGCSLDAVIATVTVMENSGLTGTGEHILRRALAKETCMLMEDGTPASAARAALRALLRISGQAGLIALDRKGRLAIMHTTDYMASGYAKGMRIQVQQGMRRVR